MTTQSWSLCITLWYYICRAFYICHVMSVPRFQARAGELALKSNSGAVINDSWGLEVCYCIHASSSLLQPDKSLQGLLSVLLEHGGLSLSQQRAVSFYCTSDSHRRKSNFPCCVVDRVSQRHSCVGLRQRCASMYWDRLTTLKTRIDHFWTHFSAVDSGGWYTHLFWHTLVLLPAVLDRLMAECVEFKIAST